jgi:hypothetical protein
MSGGEEVDCRIRLGGQLTRYLHRSRSQVHQFQTGLVPFAMSATDIAPISILTSNNLGSNVRYRPNLAWDCRISV